MQKPMICKHGHGPGQRVGQAVGHGPEAGHTYMDKDTYMCTFKFPFN